MRFLKSLPAFAAVLIVSACASVLDGPTQPLRIDTPGASESECHLTNGLKYRARGGETIRIQRSHRDLEIDCYGSGDRFKQITIPSTLNEWGVANVSNAVIPGVTYDHLSGALYAYPVVVTVDFTGTPARGFELPAYHNIDAPSPYGQPIEGFTPSSPALDSDGTYLPRGVEKRETRVNSNPFSTNGGGASSVTPAPVSPATSAASPSAPVTSSGNTGGVPSGRNAEELTRSANPDVFRNE
jgi:hypothetical protein